MRIAQFAHKEKKRRHSWLVDNFKILSQLLPVQNKLLLAQWQDIACHNAIKDSLGTPLQLVSWHSGCTKQAFFNKFPCQLHCDRLTACDTPAACDMPATCDMSVTYAMPATVLHMTDLLHVRSTFSACKGTPKALSDARPYSFPLQFHTETPHTLSSSIINFFLQIPNNIKAKFSTHATT